MLEPQPDHVVHSGTQCPPNSSWMPFQWHEPKTGPQVFGEVTISRPFGTTGNLSSSFWRVASTSPGVHFSPSTNSVKATYTAPLGDETAIIIDGTATLHIPSTSTIHRIGPGSIVTSPKGLEVEWEIDAPFFKKFWVIWNGSTPSPDPLADLQINHINDSPPEWTPYSRSDGKGGELVSGELYIIRKSGSTGSMMSGIWRAGRGIPSTNVEPDGRMVNPYIGATGDETMLVLEGEIEIVEENGKKHLFRAGDPLGLTSGMPVTWVSRAPFTRKFWIITRDLLPN